MQYKPGMVVDGIVTGIQPYGVFVAFEDGAIGLIHISELSDGFVKDVRLFVSLKDHVKVKVIDVDSQTHQLRLSIKALHKNRRNQYKRNYMQRLPQMKIGFTSIKEKMPEWIKEAQND